MNKMYCMIVLLVACRICVGQNLVPNGDFEQHSGCPSGYAQLNLATHWMNPGLGDADYYHQCATSPSVAVPNSVTGYQFAHSGFAYIGLYLKWTIPNFREYIEVELTSPLFEDSCYLFEMYICHADLYGLTTDKIGVYFSQVPITGVPNADPLPYIPQIMNATGNYPDSLNWKLVSGNYTAAGGETYLIIGNFLDDVNTNTNVINGAASQGAYVYIDDVSLTQCQPNVIEDFSQSKEAKCFPNPFSQALTFIGYSNEMAEFSLSDMNGKMLVKKQFSHSIKLETEGIEKGIYIYEVRNKNGVMNRGKVVKN